jgi:ABC-2 type transport system ATP-binding protein
MTGLEFLRYVGQLGGLAKKTANERSEELLTLVGLIEAKNQKIGKYSGGMKQRLGIAQAIIHKPILVMLDEPVSALDPFGRREVLLLLEQLKKEMTILFSTHILNDAQEICDHILFLHNGHIVESGTMEQLQNNHRKTRMIIEFRENTKKYIDSFARTELIVSSTYENNTATLVVKDLEEAKIAFLREITEHNWPLIRFEIGGLTLEDVFMEVVKK